MDLYQQMVVLNNQGVALVQGRLNGSLEHAVALFQSAMLVTCHILDEASLPDPPSTVRFHGSLSYPCSTSIAAASDDDDYLNRRRFDGTDHSGVCTNSTTSDLGDSPSTQSSPATNSAAVRSTTSPSHALSNGLLQDAFVQVLNLIPLDTAYSDDPLINIAVATSIVLFNLAVTHHRHSLLQPAQSCDDNFDRVLFEQARALYKKSLSIIIDPKYVCTGSRAVIELIAMAIHNNLAQMSFRLADYEQSRIYFDQLIWCASSVHPEAYANETALLLQYLKNVFLTNALVFMVPVTAAAA